MKRLLLWMSLLSILLLVSCNLPSTGKTNEPAVLMTATLSPVQVQTEISAMLTLMPSATPLIVTQEPADVTPTLELPTVDVGQATATLEATTVQAETKPSATPETQVEVATATVTPDLSTSTPTSTTPPQTPTATLPASDPRLRLGTPTSTDAMDNSNTWIWPTGSDRYTSASFANGIQTLTSLDEKDGWRIANPAGRDFSNTYIEATFKTGTCSGSDHYGIILRVPVLRDADQGYLFGVTCDGRYSLRRWDSKILPKGEMKRLVDWTASTAINTGSNQTNRLGIYAVGSRLIMYVNGVLLTETQDSTFPKGNFGVFIGYDVTENLVVQLDEMSYWENVQP